MSKYQEREFRLGDYWIMKRPESPAYYRAWLDGRVMRKASLGTTDWEEAKRKLEAWWIANRTMKDERPADVLMSQLLTRYLENHAAKLPSASGNRAAIGLWLAFWAGVPLSGLTVEKQEAFHAWLRRRGQKESTVLRTINIGKAAISRAFKRHEIASMPSILTVKASAGAPKGRPMELVELRALYAEAQPHLRQYIAWGLGTAARPAALMDLHSTQVDWDRGVIDLNPAGRTQNKKHRPMVKLPTALSERFDGYLVEWRGQRVKSIKTAWNRAVERAGLDRRCEPYSLRHSAARWMRLNRVSAEEVAQQLGHRTLGVTGVYTEYDPEYLKDAVAALDSLVRQVVVARELTNCKPAARGCDGLSA